jgi:hypothetical protein
MVERRHGQRAPLAGSGNGHANGHGHRNGHGSENGNQGGRPTGRRPSTLTDVVTVSGHVLAQLAPGRGGFLFDATSGHIYFLNKTSAFIFERLMRGTGVREIVTELTAAYDIDQGTALTDTLDFTHKLRDFGLGEPVEAS